MVNAAHSWAALRSELHPPPANRFPIARHAWQYAGCILLVFAAAACLAQSAKVEKVAALDDPAVSPALRNTLEPGYRITLDDGSIAANVWLRHDLPVQEKKDASGVIYPQLAESVLLGVISFPTQAADYRGNPLP